MHTSSEARQGISGRKLTIWVVVMLIVLVVGLSYVLSVYDGIDDARSETNDAWRSLALALSGRYRRVELDVARRVDAGELDMEVGEKFRLAVDRFRGTALPYTQYESAMEIEQMLQREGLPCQSAPATLKAREAYNESVLVVRKQLESPGGKALDIVLAFPDYKEFVLAE